MITSLPPPPSIGRCPLFGVSFFRCFTVNLKTEQYLWIACFHLYMKMGKPPYYMYFPAATGVLENVQKRSVVCCMYIHIFPPQTIPYKASAKDWRHYHGNSSTNTATIRSFLVAIKTLLFCPPGFS